MEGAQKEQGWMGGLYEFQKLYVTQSFGFSGLAMT